MTLRLNGSTSGSVSLDAPATGSNVTLELPTDSIKPGLVLVATQSFTTAATVSVNNCFTSTYDNYRIIFSGVGSTTAVGLECRLRASGADNSAASHNWQFVSGSATTASALRTTASTSMQVGAVSSSAGWLSMDLMGPALAASTYYNSTSGYNSTSTPIIQTYIGAHAVSTAFDGITFFPASGTITGSIAIYGYRKAV